MKLTGNNLTIEKLEKILNGEKVELSSSATLKIRSSRESVENIIKENKVVYGITTGFGLFCNVFINKEKTKELQRNLIRSHATGVGEILSQDVARLILVLRANALAKGFSGVRIKLIERLLYYVNKDIIPVIPSQGSLGASGDLVPLAHMALTLMGEGEVFYNGKREKTIKVLNELNIKPIELEAKEGLGLINGTQVMTAIGVCGFINAKKLENASKMISSLTFQALNGIIDVFEPEIHDARGFQTQINIANDYRKILAGSKLITRQGEQRVQDAYSLRCIPQVAGACSSALNYVEDVLNTEINAATDNPLIFDDGNKVLSGGNFHGEPVALAMDFLKIPTAELANISERRIERLVNPALSNGLPSFLSNNSGLESGAMILQYTAAALVSENKVLAHPASVDSIPSSANQEDHVSMGTIAARQASSIIDNSLNVLAIELFTSAQAVHIKKSRKLSPVTKEFYDKYREKVSVYKKDRIFATDIEKTLKFIKEWF